jgi:hypothetical protein
LLLSTGVASGGAVSQPVIHAIEPKRPLSSTPLTPIDDVIGVDDRLQPMSMA